MQKKSLFVGVIAVLAIAIGFFVTSGPDNASQSSTVLAQSGSFVYETYTQERFEALRGNEAFSVFVHSRSCGTCAKKHQQIIDEVNTFGNGTILKLEYDEASQEFLSEFEVTKYDTFVNFDASGNATTVKGANVEDVREEIN